MTGYAIEAVGLSKRFLMATERRTSLKERMVRGKSPEPKNFWALKDATFSVPKGSSLGIIGHNGSGKSTALKVLTGIYRPTSGSVKVEGSVSALLEVGAGFHGDLTGRENIRLNATILGFTNREIDLLMDQIIDFADIGDHIDAPLKHYSSGMYVRLGFAVAVMVRPEILIVDEVIAVGDEEFQRKCYDHLHRLRKAGTTMVIVSHGLGQIVDLCDEAVWLERGRIQEIGPSRKVTSSYLERVNRRETLRDASSEPSASPPPQASDEVLVRRGSGELRLTEIEFLDPAGQATKATVSGSALTVRMWFEAVARITSVAFGLGFVHESGVAVCGPNSINQGPWEVMEGTGFVDFRIPRLDLQQGSFDITAAAVDKGHIFDYVEGIATLRVRSVGSSEPGLVRMPGTWSLTQGGQRVVLNSPVGGSLNARS